MTVGANSPILPKRELLAHLSNGHSAAIAVVTPNRRLAQTLAREFDDIQIGSGLKAWEPADIVPFGTLVERLYEQALYSDIAAQLPLLLTPAQEQFVWEQIVAESGLLSIAQAAAQCRDAWRLRHAWRIPPQAGNDDAAAFKKETGISVYKWNIANYDACKKGVEHVVQDLGGSVDVLINNAGITRDGFIHKMPTDNWKDVIDTNLTSCFNMAHCVIEHMREKKFGRIVNISSVNGQLGQMGQTNYSAAKAGIFGFTKALARETASKGITVNTIAPGYISTEMVKGVKAEVMEKIIATIPVGRLGTPEEIARAVLFLVAEEASFITGETLSINGGQYME